MTSSISITIPYEIETFRGVDDYDPRKTKVTFRLEGKMYSIWFTGYTTGADIREKIAKIVNSTPINSDDDRRRAAEKYEAMLHEQIANALKVPKGELEWKPAPYEAHSFSMPLTHYNTPATGTIVASNESLSGGVLVNTVKAIPMSHLGSVTKFDEREMKEVRFAQDYVKNYNHGTPGSLTYTTLDKMAKVANELAESRRVMKDRAEMLAITADSLLKTISSSGLLWAGPVELERRRGALIEALSSWNSFKQTDKIGK
jgi:hypothetical protein